MPLFSFELNQPHQIRAGDVVAHAVDKDAAGAYSRRAFVHVGLAIADATDASFDRPVSVYHMANVVRVDDWGWRRDGNHESIVDFVGVYLDIDDATRDEVVDCASSLYARRDANAMPRVVFYWQGTPSSTSHPNYPHEKNAYAFSCATFVNQCYEKAVNGGLVSMASVPELTQEEYDELKAVFGSRIEASRYRRLDSCYLLASFHEDSAPLASSNWEQYRSNQGPVFQRFNIP